MTRNCLNIMRKFASLAKYADHPSKYTSLTDWILNSQLYKTLSDEDRVQALYNDWEAWENAQQKTNRSDASQSNTENEMPRQWFDNVGYTEAEYNKYKGYGNSLKPSARERMIHSMIQMDRHFSRPSVGPSTTSTVPANGSSSVATQTRTAAPVRPVIPRPALDHRDAWFKRYGYTAAERAKYWDKLPTSPHPSLESYVHNRIQEDRRNSMNAATQRAIEEGKRRYEARIATKPTAASAKSWVDSKVNQDYTDVYPRPAAPMSVDEIYRDPAPVQKPAQKTAPKPAPVDKGLNVSGFSLAGLGSDSVSDGVPEHLRSSGGYQPGPAKLKEVDLNSLF